MRRIAIPIDFSDKTHNTINYGVKLANIYGSDIELIYVINMAYYGATYSTPADMATIPEISQEVEIEKIDAAKRSFEKTLEQLKIDHSNLPKISIEIKSGIESDIISSEILKENIDMLLLTGGKNDSFLKFISNENHSLIESAHCPVMVIPNTYSFKTPSNIVYATDFNEADLPTMKRLVKIIKPFNSKIKALHITDSKTFKDKIKASGFKEEISKEINYFPVEFHTLSGEDTTQSVIDFAQKDNTDLIVLLKENRGFFKKLFHQSVTEEIADHASIPVLIFHNENNKSI